MESKLESILVESIQLEAENISLKELIRFYKSKAEIQEQLKNMVHYSLTMAHGRLPTYVHTRPAPHTRSLERGRRPLRPSQSIAAHEGAD